ncbi:MAG: DEAD/DEAH box helicase [Acidimicrobiia bacterium]
MEGPVADLAGRLTQASAVRELDEPPGLEATLRPYQRRGLAWLVEMCGLGLGGVLADDMGLGKTVQVLALHIARGAGRSLVVCPASVLGNWEREAHRFVPDVPVLRYHGTDRTLADVPTDALVLTTYGTLRRDIEAIRGLDWAVVVADEAQAIKNPYARVSRAIRSVESGARVALTGTPVENHLGDLWAILDWTTPGLLGPLETFRHEIAVPIERHGDEHAADLFGRLVRPFLLRRRKTDPGVAPDLPPKIETDELMPLTTEQATLYRATVADVMEQIEEAEGMNRRGLVLKLLTGLKQICNHPAQFLGQTGPLAGRSGKLDGLTELVEVIADEGDATLVFTQYVAMGRLLDTHLSGRGLRTRFLHGGTAVKRRTEMVDEFQAGDVDVFLISLKAGGTGLNLTRANHVVHYDRWWNPAVEDQASDRAWRIGQDRTLQIHRMVCEGTIEDRIGALLAAKRSLADAVVGSGEGWITELTNDDLAALVELGRGD